ncbi:Hypothetical protein BN69_1541 [Methylocystis sp. SC2]|nr:Hypothetical protein BN69_1541 [Methylocystis sp. SC2]
MAAPVGGAFEDDVGLARIARPSARRDNGAANAAETVEEDREIFTFRPLVRCAVRALAIVCATALASAPIAD